MENVLTVNEQFCHDFFLFDYQAPMAFYSCGFMLGDCILRLNELLDKNGHILLFDNWFNFLELQKVFLRKCIDYIGMGNETEKTVVC